MRRTPRAAAGRPRADLRPWRGLISILVVCAAVALLFTARYPDGLYRFLMGLHRWVFRVAAYGLLLRDEYPPFRLDDGGDDPGTVAPPPAPPQDHAASW